MAVSDAVFNALDVNQDGVLDQSEFGQLAGGVTVGTGLGYNTYGVSGLVGASGYSGYDSSLAYANGGYAASYGSETAYESAAAANAAAAAAASAGAVYTANAGVVSDASAYGVSSAVQTYAADSQGLYQDPNPAIIRRPAPAGVQTYTQNIRLRFLQPPPVPPHGPLVIREVRPPQPPVPAPLRIRQQAPPLPTPPPLVLRERPPQPPAVIPSQTVIRRLAAIPVPPRSVIVERIPALPARPRDVVIERWTPYAAQAKRRVLLQRAAPARPYPAPRNVIIQYEQSPARIVRQFQRLGVVAANPSAYVQTYGGSLLDSVSLVQTARSAGVVEDITPPVTGINYSAAYGQDYLNYGAANLAAVNAGAVNVGAYGLTTDLSGYESSGYSYADGGYAGLGGYSTIGANVVGGVNLVDAAFQGADVNKDGVIDRAEFSRLVQ